MHTHKTRIHGEKKILECSECKETFANHKLLSDHMNFVHDVKHECQSCNEVFPSNWKLSVHLRTEHGIRPTYECTVCKRTVEHLAAHMRLCHSSETHLCSLCGKSFKNSRILNKHVKGVHEKAFTTECIKCNAMFKTNKALRFHMDFMHEGKERLKCSHPKCN